ncbi:hypothetical protein ESB00_13160 [Oleiharenicola lentus]|jgi:hypothetical protein|uniref:Uncharacterized protein n=1 Tax=Oleiharenicola lentus TaxID=2508720 RepID=A0A4Q1CCC8_9BACT|nr:hypothetical protein [Oleiharenicola lentus]RXK56774.1 hypothetical protein ESB00_13160 [Oleiharenicola lentus]
MGLTLHYKLRAPSVTGEEPARVLVTQMREAALALKQAGRIERVGAISSSPAQLAWLSEWIMVPVPDEPNTTRGVEVPAQAGYVFNVTLGEGCEPLRLGLCDYTVEWRDHDTHRLERVGTAGWRLSGFCKTQYASLGGWEPLRRAHTAAVDLLAGLAKLGVGVEITDEGGYWPGRDEAELRRTVERMNGIVAAFAGAMKDATEEVPGGAPVQSPIFAHPQFEHLEAEGMAREGKFVEQAVKLARKAKK